MVTTSSDTTRIGSKRQQVTHNDEIEVSLRFFDS